MADDEVDDEHGRLAESFGWTSSRARRMYYVHHATFEELLKHLRLKPIPDAPPATWRERRSD